ncbi:MAG: hypothetical protein CMI16_03255 [Opitutaceae bacterium]|nr:hypothetical protein [Opitutaceae bacterium]
MAYACRILVADAMGGSKVLMKVGIGLSRHDREVAIVRAVFGNVDVERLHHRLEREWFRVGAKSSTATRRNPTGSDLSDMFWTLFLRRVYREETRGASRFDDVVDVSRRLVVSGGKVGTRRCMRSDFFAERGVSPNPLRTTLEGLATTGIDDKTFAREWFANMGWDDVLVRTKNEPPSTATISDSSSSYMQHPLDTPPEAPMDFIELGNDVDAGTTDVAGAKSFRLARDRAVARPIADDDTRGRLPLFECGFGCGRAWDGNSQCPC